MIPNKTPPRVGLHAYINRYNHKEFTRYHVTRSLEDLAGQFSISMSAFYNVTANLKSPATIDLFPDIAIGDPIVIFINETPILTGFIEKMDVAYSPTHHEITIMGRDAVADLIDSTLGTTIELAAPITFIEVLERVKDALNLKHINVIDQSGGMEPFQAAEIVTGNTTQTAFSFIEHYARQRQVLLTTDGLGNIVVARQSAVRAQGSLIHRANYTETDTDTNGLFTKVFTRVIDPDANTVLDAAIHWDYTKCFHEYRVISQANPSAADKGVTPLNAAPADNTAVASPTTGVAYDPNVRASRVLHITAEQSLDETQLKKRAEWEAKIRRARAFNYSCKVQGHTMGILSTLPWVPNLKVAVVDEFADIDKDYIIKSVAYEYSLSGTTTSIDVVELDSYLPQPLVKQSELHTKHHKKPKDGGVDPITP